MLSDQERAILPLLNKGPEVWLAYLRPFEEGEPITDLSMLVIFHYTVVLAKKQSSLDWAEVAVRAAELEARTTSSEIGSEDARLWAMRLRSSFIAKMGSRSTHFVLDKEVVLNWVMEGLKLSVQVTKGKISSLAEIVALAQRPFDPEDWRRLHAVLSELRPIKNRLDVAKVLADCGELPRESALNQWLELCESLP